MVQNSSAQPEPPPPGHYWLHALQRALARNDADAQSRYFQLASIDDTGHPRNRTLVFRGFADEHGTLLAVTDTRSAKHAQLGAAAAVELCWYFSATREQFRISGRVQLHAGQQGDGALRTRCWAALSPPAREQFFQPAPGLPLGTDAAVAICAADSGEPPAAEAAPPPTFCVLAVQPQQVDYLNLLAGSASGAVGHQRWRSTLCNGSWHAQALNP